MKLVSATIVLLALIVSVTAVTKRTPCRGDARYSVKFYYAWTPERFPMDFPPRNESGFSPMTGDPHFAPLTGAAHNRRVSAYTVFGYATPGIERVSELGNNSVLIGELEGNPLVGSVAAAEAAVPYNTNETIQLTVNPMNTRITAVAMIAPSPDWFTGVDNLEMCASNGEYKEKRYGFLYALDAGTDDGETYLAEDADTQPRDNIVAILEAPFYGVPVGHYEIALMQ